MRGGFRSQKSEPVSDCLLLAQINEKFHLSEKDGLS